MALKYTPNAGSRTDVNISGKNSVSSVTNGTAARKYASKEVTQPAAPPPPSNSDHIVSQTTSLKSLASVVDSIASHARDALTLSRAAVEAVVADGNPTKKSVPSFSESSLANSQRALVGSALARSSVVGKGLDRARRLAGDLVPRSLDSFVPPKARSDIPSGNTAVPEIDHVAVGFDKTKGVVDCFFVTIVFDLPAQKISSGQIKAVRIFRAESSFSNFFRDPGQLSVHGVDLLSSNQSRSRSKVGSSVMKYESTLRQSGVSNALSNLSGIDSITGVRRGTKSAFHSSNSDLSAPTSVSSNDSVSKDLQPYVDPGTLVGIDRSVANDPNFIRNAQTQNPSTVARLKPAPVVAGRSIFVGNVDRFGHEPVRQVRDEFSVKSNVAVGPGNKLGFREIAFLSPEKISSRQIGDVIEYLFDDDSVTYGKSYKYYIVTVDENMNESGRSRLAQVDVEGLRVPESPKRVVSSNVQGAVSLSILVEDMFVEKFEIYRKEIDPGYTQEERASFSAVSSANGFVVENVVRERMGNGFLQIGESLNGGKGGSTFHDRSVRPGMKYVYRVYSVDVFGNKSERPTESQVFLPNPATKNTILRKPSLLVEIDSKTNRAKVTITSNDSRIIAMFLGRRDVTIGQQAFVAPGEPERVKLGNGDLFGPGRFLGARLADKSTDVSWNGYFAATGQPIVFVDKTAQIDRTYQYSVYGIDKFGNMTPFEISKKIFIVNRPMINAPMNLSGTLSIDDNGRPLALTLSWDDGNLDISAEDRLGNRQDLEDTHVRTLFQVERRRSSEDNWREFPLSEGGSIVDLVQPLNPTVTAPPYLPENIKVNESYVYRVAAYQTGSFISNFCSPIEVSVSSPILEPENFRVAAPDTKKRPYFLVLNWDTPQKSGAVDRWEIERAVVNNLAAAKLNPNRPSDFSSIEFTKYRTVYRESSRFRERNDDETSSKPPSNDLATGQHYFADQNVDFGNTYFYRIRAVPSVGQEVSNWIYKGMKITDETFEKKLDSLISQTEVKLMIDSFSPMTVKSTYLSPTEEPNTSLSLAPLKTTYVPMDSISPTLVAASNYVPPPQVTSTAVLAASTVIASNPISPSLAVASTYVPPPPPPSTTTLIRSTVARKFSR